MTFTNAQFTAAHAAATLSEDSQNNRQRYQNYDRFLFSVNSHKSKVLMLFTSWFGICNKHTLYIYEIVVWWVLVMWGGGGGCSRKSTSQWEAWWHVIEQIGLTSIASALQRDHVQAFKNGQNRCTAGNADPTHGGCVRCKTWESRPSVQLKCCKSSSLAALGHWRLLDWKHCRFSCLVTGPSSA